MEQQIFSKHQYKVKSQLFLLKVNQTVAGLERAKDGLKIRRDKMQIKKQIHVKYMEFKKDILLQGQWFLVVYLFPGPSTPPTSSKHQQPLFPYKRNIYACPGH